MPKILGAAALLALTGCATIADPPPVIAPSGPAECVACAALPPPSSSVVDTPETRRLMDVFFTVWACACAPDLAAERGVVCNE